MLWLYLHFPSLQLDGLIKEHIGEQPVLAIIDEHKNEIVQLTQAAKNSGLALGMGLATAASLEHQLVILPYCAQTEKQQLLAIVEQLYQVSSDIAVDPPQGLYLRIENMLALYGDISKYWHVLQSVLLPKKITINYASAFSPYAAKILAKAQLNQLIIEQHSARLALNQQDIKWLAVDNKTRQKLLRLGIKTIGQLISLPSEQLSQRFDKALSQYLADLVGDRDLPMVFYQPKEIFCCYQELLYEIDAASKLIFPIEKLVHQFMVFLQKANVASEEIELTLFLRDQQQSLISVKSATPIYRQQQWLALIKLTLEGRKLSAPVVAIKFYCHRLSIQAPSTKHFFESGRGEYSRENLLSLLSAKLGEEHVHALILGDDHRPECANDYVNFSLAKDELLPSQVNENHPSYQTLRPSYLLKVPQLLNSQVTVVSAPERIDTAWWHHPIKRDYFIARNQDGQWCWLFRQLDNRWFIHGYFA